MRCMCPKLTSGRIVGENDRKRPFNTLDCPSDISASLPFLTRFTTSIGTASSSPSLEGHLRHRRLQSRLRLPLRNLTMLHPWRLARTRRQLTLTRRTGLPPLPRLSGFMLRKVPARLAVLLLRSRFLLWRARVSHRGGLRHGLRGGRHLSGLSLRGQEGGVLSRRSRRYETCL